MRHLLSVVHGPVFGGAHNQALQLAEPLARRGWETIVVLPDDDGDAHRRLTEAGLHVIRMPLHRLRATPDVPSQLHTLAGFRREVTALRHLIRQLRIDVVQVHGPVNLHGAIAARLESTAVVWQLLDTRAPVAVRAAAFPMVAALADVVMPTGWTTAKAHPGIMGLGKRVIPFVPPVDPTRFGRPSESRKQRAKKQLGVATRSLLVGSVGNRNPQKGHEFLIEAARLLRERRPEVELRIRGNPSPAHQEYEFMLQGAARAAGFDEATVDQLPEGVSVADIMPAFDVFVLASVPRSEGLPTVILEAMATALPVVATDVGGVRELVDDGVTGNVVEPSDAGSLANAIGRLLDDPQSRRRMGEAARQRVLAKWNVERSADTHEQAYRTAVDLRRLRLHPE